MSTPIILTISIAPKFSPEVDVNGEAEEANDDGADGVASGSGEDVEVDGECLGVLEFVVGIGCQRKGTCPDEESEEVESLETDVVEVGYDAGLWRSIEG